MNKRGQVVVFVIIGIIIVLGALAIYFGRDYLTGSRDIEEISVPAEVENVYGYVASCADEVLEDAVLLLGRQGGYIDIPGDPINTGEFSNSLNLFGNSNVVYWYYVSDNNLKIIQKPNVESMELEISEYVNQNLRDCLGDFTEYDRFDIGKGDISTETYIEDSRVVVIVNYPIKATREDFSYDFTKFRGVFNVPLRDLFEIANKIYDLEDEDLVLEGKTIDIMGNYDEIPFVGETSDCIAPFWIKENVRRDFKNILRENILFYRIKGTNYELANEKNSYFELDADIKDRKDVDVNFLFSERWPFEFEVFPEDKGLMKGFSVTESLGEVRAIAEAFVCISTYEFLYNVRYPVLIILNKDDYFFQYAMMVVIDKNEARENKDEFLTFENYDQRFCKEQVNFIVDTVDSNFRNLDDVEIEYKCINHRCDLGESDGGVWRGKAPLCINGAFIGNKKGYHFGKSIISTNQEGSALLLLEKLSKINVGVLVSRAGSGELREGETAFIELREPDKEFNRVIIYPNQKTVELIPGNYEVSVRLISPKRDGLRIPDETVENCVEVPQGVFGGLFGLTEEKCDVVKIPGTTIDQIITGTETFEVLITENDLRQSRVIFYAPYHGVINDIRDIGNLVEQPGRLPIFK